MASIASEQSSVKKKRQRKNIFVSYSSDAGFLERKFISDTVKELKTNNLAEDIWFDQDEHNTDNPCWFSMRMEAAEKCKAAILFVSDSFLACPVSVYEAKIFLQRQLVDSRAVALYFVITQLSSNKDIPKYFKKLEASDSVDFTADTMYKLSLAEKVSTVIGTFMNQLEQHATVKAPPLMEVPVDAEFTGLFKTKKISQWTANDLQEWLFKLGVKEFYRQSIAEQMVDGFLLMALTDYDMIHHLGIESRVIRRKIMHSIIEILDSEHKMRQSWHLRTRTIKPKVGTIYLVYDPADVRLAQGIKQDLTRKGCQIQHHHKLGQSKEEFLQENSALMASSATIIVIITDAAANSPFVFHEIMFSDWLGKRVLVAMFKNVWNTLRPSLKAVLGDCATVDFESQMYEDSMDVLEHHLRPQRSLPGVILEQSFLNRMSEGVQPLAQICNANGFASLYTITEAAKLPTVYISYQWDVQARVDDIQRVLQHNNIVCWKDPTPKLSMASNSLTANALKNSNLVLPRQITRGHSGMSVRSSHASTADTKKDSIQSLVQQNMKTSLAVIACITPKYIQSEHCVKDLTVADSVFHKPIVPILLQYCPWPPEGTSFQIRKILARFKPIDLSTDKLFRQNLPILLDRVKKIVLPLELKN